MPTEKPKDTRLSGGPHNSAVVASRRAKCVWMMASTAAAQVRVRAGRRGVDVVRISRPPAVDAKDATP